MTASKKARPVRPISVDAVDVNPWQPRKRFDEVTIQGLASSIQALGLLHPINVRLTPGFSTGESGQRYQLVAGELRLRAHQLLALPTIQAIVVEVSDEDMALLALSENLNREDLADAEIAQSILAIIDQFPSARAAMEWLGIDHNKFYRLMSYSHLPEFVNNSLRDDPTLLSKRYAYELSSMLGAEQTGDTALASLLFYWPHVVAGDLRQSHLVKRVREDSIPPSPERPDDRNEQLYLDDEPCGQVTYKRSLCRIDLKRSTLSSKMISEIVALVKKALFRDNLGALNSAGAGDADGAEDAHE